MNQQQPFPADLPFTREELYTIAEVFGIAAQAVASIRSTSSGGIPPEGKAGLIRRMQRIRQQAQDLRGQLADDDPTVLCWHVWPLDGGGNEIASVSEFYAATAAGALAQTAGMALTRCPDVAGWKVIRAPEEQCTHLDATDEAEPDA